MNMAEFDQERMREFARKWIENRGRGAQTELAKLLKISEPTVSRFLAGKTELHKSTLAKLAEILGVTRPAVIRDPFIDLSERLHALANFVGNDAQARDYRIKEFAATIKAIHDNLAGLIESIKAFTKRTE